MLSVLNKPKDNDARLVLRGGEETLVASFSDSIQPVLWQMSLVKTPEFTLQIVEADGVWALGFIAPGKPFVPVAQFVTRDEADLAFQALGKALLQGQTASKMPKYRWLVLLLLIFVAINFLPASERKTASFGDAAGVATDAKHAAEKMFNGAPKAEKMQDGVPFVADDVLKLPVD